MRPAVFNPRRPSLIRGAVLVFASLLAAIRLSGFPAIHPDNWIAVPLLIATLATADTARCMRRRWDWYHGGVILILYAELMILVLLAGMLLYPVLMH